MVLFSNKGTVWRVGLVIRKKKGAIPKNPPFLKSIMSDSTIWSWHTEPNMVAGRTGSLHPEVHVPNWLGTRASPEQLSPMTRG
jgi:hypothetical protein